MFQVYFLSKVDLETIECPKPCTFMTVETNLLKDLDSIYDNYNWGNIKFDEKVDINTDTNNYDVFALLVEAGSSLGLWVGLSALGIVDAIIHFNEIFFNYFKSKPTSVRYSMYENS